MGLTTAASITNYLNMSFLSKEDKIDEILELNPSKEDIRMKIESIHMLQEQNPIDNEVYTEHLDILNTVLDKMGD